MQRHNKNTHKQIKEKTKCNIHKQANMKKKILLFDWLLLPLFLIIYKY